MPNSIFQHIIAHSSATSNISRYQSSLREFTNNFKDRSNKVWPLDLSDIGYTTTYRAIEKTFSQAGAFSGLEIKASISNASEQYDLNTTWTFYDDQLNINIDNFSRKKGTSKNKPFAGEILSRLQNFIKTYESESRLANESKNDPSEITLTAVSNTSKTASCGGYIWAQQGVDFKSKEDLANMQNAFRIYAANHGVLIATADIKRFRYPCHFAAFDCGIKVKDKFGKLSSLGKSFLLVSQWEGIVRPQTPRNILSRYSQLYNLEAKNPDRSSKLLKVLESGYQKMLKRYTNKYTTLKRKKGFAVYKRYALMQLRRLSGL